MANINRQWKRFLATGCSHGHLADEHALRAVLKFAKHFKPQTKIHLGDFTDQAAFRSGAQGTSDESVSIADDLKCGLSFLRELRPTDIISGNHEDRLYKLAFHHNEIVSRAAISVIGEIRDLASKLKARHIEHYDINKSWIKYGDTLFSHGFMFSQNAMMEHAEHFGKCVIAHLHIAGMVPGRRMDNPHCWCVGTLANIPSMSYAKSRRATSRWSHGFAWGEYSDTECHVNLSQCPPNQAADWRLPL